MVSTTGLDSGREVSRAEGLAGDVPYDDGAAPKMAPIRAVASCGAREAASRGITVSIALIAAAVFHQAATLGRGGPIASIPGRASAGRRENGREVPQPLSWSEKVAGSSVGLGQGSVEVRAAALASMPSASKGRGAMGGLICPAGSFKRPV